MTTDAKPFPASDADNRWHAENLEYLNHCPVCFSTARRTLHANMVDRLFRCAPGEWTLQVCQKCAVVYLDPRPDIKSISKAYGKYFTHQEPAVTSPPIQAHGRNNSLKQWLRTSLHAAVNGYRNARWQMNLQPSSTWGRWLVPWIGPLRAQVTEQMRHLPGRPPHEGARLLDVGCGNGAFLQLAKAAGWDAQGVDFDPLALAAARARNLNVHEGGLEQFASHPEKFDWITCSHVIEHVHDPIRWLKDMHALLVPGGSLWLQTPNIDSIGHEKFGPDWRDLDPPRHLVLFNAKVLGELLKSLNFEVKMKNLPAMSAMSVYATSDALRANVPSIDIDEPGGMFKLRNVAPALRQAWLPNRSEFLTVIATKAIPA